MSISPGNVFIELLKGNNSGEFVGNYFSPADSLVHAFVRDRNGLLRSFVYPGAAVTVAGGITDSGAVVGSYTTDATTATGWVSFIERTAASHSHSGTRIRTLQGTITLGINEQGSIVGVFTLTGSPALHALRGTGAAGSWKSRFPPPRRRICPISMNPERQLVSGATDRVCITACSTQMAFASPWTRRPVRAAMKLYLNRDQQCRADSGCLVCHVSG